MIAQCDLCNPEYHAFVGARIPLWGFGKSSENYFFSFFFFFCVFFSFSHPSCEICFLLFQSTSLERFLSVAVLLKHL